MEEEIISLKDLTLILEKEEKPEEKLKTCLAFMRNALNGKLPNFRDFWEIQKHCLPLFKEKLPTADRAVLWGEYVNLSKEVRRLRALLDEQANFAQEQIQLALGALENDLNCFEERLSQISSLDFPQNSPSLQKMRENYGITQRKLTLLSQFANRVQELRREVLTSTMRSRIKNQLLEKLSKLGDAIFPQRKECIQELSQMYQKNVSDFIAANFQEKETKGFPHVLKEEICAFQLLAKQLMLSTTIFQETRENLSQCWKIACSQEEKRKKSQSAKTSSVERSHKKYEKEKNQMDKRVFEPARSSTRIEALKVITSLAVKEDAFTEEETQKVLTQEDKSILSEQLKKLVQKRKEMKKNIAEYRKVAGGSTLNLEESMHYREVIEEDRIRLEKLEGFMQQIQNRLYT